MIIDNFLSDDSKNVLILGCGGGYDIFTGLPIYFECESLKKYNVYLVSYSFTKTSTFQDAKIENICQDCYLVDHNKIDNNIMNDNAYFPEYHLSKHLDISVYAICTHIKKSIYENALKTLIDLHQIDTIIVVDGGCDSILSGREEDLATPVEDMITICTVRKLYLNGIIKHVYLTCLGTTIELIKKDDFQINLENIYKQNGHMYHVSLRDMYQNNDKDIIQKYIDTIKNCDPKWSVINSSIIASIEGHDGRYHNPLLEERISCDINFPDLSDATSILWIFDLNVVADHVIYLREIDKLDEDDEIDAFIMYMNDKFHPPRRSVDFDIIYGKDKMIIIRKHVESFIYNLS